MNVDQRQVTVPCELHPLMALRVSQVAAFLARSHPDAWVYFDATLGALVTYRLSDDDDPPQDAP